MPHRVAMALKIVTMMTIAAAIPDVGGEGWTYFALSYALNRALTAFLPTPVAYWVFAAGVAAIQLQYMLQRVGTLRFERFVPQLGHISERFGLLMLILLGEGFFKLVVTLADKGVYIVSAGTLFNVTMGGLSLFALAWTYFDCAGNAKPKSRTSAVLLRYWFAHIVILWSAVTIGVALAGEVYVGLWEPYPAGYGALASAGLAVFLASLWALRRTVADATDNYHSAGLRLFGIVMALVVLAVHPFVPSIVSNGLWVLALFSQIGVPIFLALRYGRRSDKML